MNVIPVGYKQTVAGVIPQDWNATKLGDFVFLKRGHDLTDRDRGRGDVPVMGSAGQNGFHDTALVKGPGVVVGRSGASFGQAHFCKADFWPHNTALYVTDFRGNDRLFAFFFLRSIDFSRHNSGGAQQSLNRNFISPIPIGIPPLSEQEAIADALSNVDALIESLEQLTTKKRYLKHATAEELLTEKRRLPGFHGKWEARTINSFSAFVTKGATPTTYGFKWESDGVLFLRSECVSAEGLDLDQSMFISEAAHTALNRGEVRDGDLLMTITGNVGRVLRLPTDFGVANINQHIARIRIKAIDVSPEFVFHYLSQEKVRAKYALITTGQAYPQISLKQVRETLVPLPSCAEQAAIATILSDMDTEIAELDSQLAKARTLRQGMMHQLLTGKIRLI